MTWPGRGVSTRPVRWSRRFAVGTLPSPLSTIDHGSYTPGFSFSSLLIYPCENEGGGGGGDDALTLFNSSCQ